MKKTFKVDVWDRRVTFCLTKEEFAKITKEDGDYDCVCFSKNGNAVILVDMDTFKDAPQSTILRSLSHECNHAAIDMLEACDVPISHENQEAICYTQDYIFSVCYKFLSKWTAEAKALYSPQSR